MCKRVDWGSILGVERNTLIILKEFWEGDELGNVTEHGGDTSIIVVYVEH